MKLTTPFKSPETFEDEFKEFANVHKTIIAEHSKRISDYFEISCYNMIITYYESVGYTLTAQNLKGDKFKYKCSPAGLLQNFSYFKASRDKETGDSADLYIYHSATVQSAFTEDVFTTPDIVVSSSKDAEITTDYYLTKKKLSYIGKDNLVTFCEAKYLSPFPELIINFVGAVYELMPDCLGNDKVKDKDDNIAPSLMMSGRLNKPMTKIKEALESRYYLNVFDNLFDNEAMKIFKNPGLIDLTTLGTKGQDKNNM